MARNLIHLALVAATLVAAPALDLARSEPLAAAPASVAQIAETRWAGITFWDDGADPENNDWKLYFRGDGVLFYTYHGTTYDNGRWRQRDMLVTFHTNDYWSLYVGHLRGNVMQGVAYNKTGNTGKWTFRRQ